MSDPNSDNYIPDGSITASVSYSSYIASFGRLNGYNKRWAVNNDNDPWIQADIGRLVNMYGIQTQGSGSVSRVATLKVSTFQNVPGSGDGDFIQDENEVKVCKE